MIDIQYDITVMGGREVSRPYRVFSPKASGFSPFGDATDLIGDATDLIGEVCVGAVVWLIHAFTQKKPRNGGFSCGYLFYALEFVTD